MNDLAHCRTGYGRPSAAPRAFSLPRARATVGHVPKVTAGEWGVALTSLVLAGSSYLVDSYGELAVLAASLALANLALVLLAVREAVNTRVLGRVLLLGATQVFFWLEALGLARQQPSFAVPDGPPFLSGQFEANDVRMAFVYVALFQTLLLVGYSVRPRLRRAREWVAHRMDSRSRLTGVVIHALAACAWIPVLARFGFDIGLAGQALMASRSGEGPASQDVGMLHYLQFLGVYGVALLIVRAFVYADRLRATPVLIAAGAVLPLVMSGTRFLLLFVALPACVVAFRRYQKRIGTLRLARWGLAALGLVLVAQVQLAVRQYGWREVTNLKMEQMLETTVTGQFTALLFAQHLVPGAHEYFHESVIPYFVVHWIPRSVWPDKPIMRSWSYYNDEYTQGAAFNVTPSIIGQYHMSWGVIGVMFIGIWFGLLAGITDRLFLEIDLGRQQAMAVGLGIFYAFIVASFRFYSPIYFTYCVLAFVGVVNLSAPESRGATSTPRIPLRSPL